MIKKYVYIFSFVYFICVIICMGINYYVDPWNFYGKTTTVYIPYLHERKLKSAYLNNNRNRYNAVLIGSSRGSYFNASLINKYKVFNYSVSGIGIKEYLPYLKFYEKTQKTPEVIFLTLDFFNTNKNIITRTKNNLNDVVSFAESRFSQFLEYFKIKNLHRSLEMIMNNSNDSRQVFTRSFTKEYLGEKKMLSNSVINETISGYKKYCYNDYLYNNEFKSELIKIKKNFPSSRFVAMILPVHASLAGPIKAWTKENDYERMKKEICDVFEECIDFNSRDTLTQDPALYFDPSHFYPSVSLILLEEIGKKI